MGTWGGARRNAGPWKRAAIEAILRGDSDEAVAAISGRPAAAVAAKRAELAGEPKQLALRLVSDNKVPAEPKKAPKFSPHQAERIIAASAAYAHAKSRGPEKNPFKLPSFPPGAVPKEKNLRMAMDDNLTWAGQEWATANGYPQGYLGQSGVNFFPYTYLAELTQRVEYRVVSETIADDATRKWIDFDVTGDEADKDRKKQEDDETKGIMRGEPMTDEERQGRRGDRVKKAGKADKVKALKDDQQRLELRDNMYAICRDDGFFGRSHAFLDFGHDLDSPATMEELKTPIGDGRDKVSRRKIGKGSFNEIRTVEAMWVYPTTYDARIPLKRDFYNPEIWLVNGIQVHRSRLLRFISHPVADILKPAFSFGGMSNTQLIQPYVDIWLKTRQSIGELIHAFSVMVLMTDLQTLLQEGSDVAGLMARVAQFNALRDNMGAFVLNKATEDFKNVSASLAGLHELQAQAQEHMASASRIPLVKLTGISPSGLNACLTGDTLIETDQGHVPIRDVYAGQEVMTRRGWAPIAKAGCTGYATELIEIETAESTIRCTADHRIWLPSINAFVPAGNVRHGDLLLYRGAIDSRNTESLSRIEADGGGTEGMAITHAPRLTTANICFTERYGAFIKGQSRLAATSITATKIARTISSIISKCCQPKSTQRFTALTLGSLFENLSNMSANVAIAGIGLPFQSRRGLSFAATGAGLPIDGGANHRKLNRVRSAFAACVAYLSSPRERTQNIALENAQARAKTARHICPTTTKKTGTGGSNTPNSELLSVVCSVRRVPAQEFVYDIQVAPGFLPEFFANGICVHNSSEGEIRVYYDTIAAYQNRFMRPNLTRIVNFQQLSLWGEVDPEITFNFEPLWEMSAKEKAELQKADAERHQVYVDQGAIAPAEVRGIIINDPELPYADLDPDDVPDLKEEEEAGLEPEGGRPDPDLTGQGPNGGGKPGGAGGQDGKTVPFFAEDAELFSFATDDFKESDHPRGQPGNAGQFGSGGGGSGKETGGEERRGAPAAKGSAGAATKLYKAPTRSVDQIIASVPGAAEAVAKVKAKFAESVPTDAPVDKGGFKNPDGTYTPARAAVHRKIIESIFTPEAIAAATPPPGQKPVMTLLGGRGGSGKSWITADGGPVDSKTSILLDADAIKTMLPGYEGWNAGLYHEESSDITAIADELATALGVNVIHDATMKSEATPAVRMANYEKAGYDVAGYYMYASPETAATRALGRFSKKGSFSGRFVPLEIILNHNTRNESNFDKLSPGMKRWAIYDNDGAKGEPRLVAKSED